MCGHIEIGSTEFKYVHISTVKSGDTIFHDGQLRTVSNSNFGRSFFGISLFGDSYNAGNKPVKKALLRV